MKSKMVLVSLIYTIIAWIAALLNRFNPGGNDTYSLIVFSAFLIFATWGIFAMYLAIVIYAVVSIVKANKDGGDKSSIKPCIINALISTALVSTIFITYAIQDFHF